MNRARVVLSLLFLGGMGGLVQAHDLNPSAWTVGTNYGLLGLEHLWGGWDHLAFLAGLLLPGGSGWRIVKVVTAFTAAHCLTLTLAALGVVSPPSWLVEPAIALSVVLVAWNALVRPQGLAAIPDRRVALAFGFGLVHGFGFAGALAEVGFPPGQLVPALAGFNLGLEAAQLSVVVVVLPLLTALRRLPTVHRGTVTVGSLVVGLAGATWLSSRILS